MPEGIPAAFPERDGKTVYTALSYNGSTYMPLRTVGRWMGQKYLVGQCIAHGIPVRHYGKVLSMCG